ncbi:MAG: hypothetical protein J2O48_03940 [Solirubrobacterales bacterium]|nr:hypothetical protein [Solirubrobacterales bacterium]
MDEWAAAKARETLGAESDPAELADLTQVLTNLTRGARERGELLAFAWYPERQAVPFAQLALSTTLQGESKLTLDALETVCGWRDEETRQLDVSTTDLPVGTAIRVCRAQGVDDGVVISVTYATVLAHHKCGLIFRMDWLAEHDEPLFAEMADQTAKSLRVEG